ncbi:MAG TPA: hypothetical protein DCL77_09575 [Prolixibacteraceae bacterium]|jgi:hypothetical protein|nr:hypothetical protein [Prolixibacteraceae bacterium]
MRHIPIQNLQEEFDEMYGTGAFESWKIKASEHLEQIKSMNPDERSNHWKKNNIWMDLYPALSRLSGHKCWYSEKKESEFSVDHFRPKALSKNHDGNKIQESGYWWLSYYWGNFRLAGNLVNLLRKDRFTDEEEVYGKGNFFPLDLENGSKAQEGDLYCTIESRLLLDPIVASDTEKISFDQNGEPYPSYSEGDDLKNYMRGKLSIKYYGLKHTPLTRERAKIWVNCNNLVELTNNYLKYNINNPALVTNKLDTCFEQFAEMANFKSPFSMVVKNYLLFKCKETNYEWLEKVLKVI